MGKVEGGVGRFLLLLRVASLHADLRHCSSAAVSLPYGPVGPFAHFCPWQAAAAAGKCVSGGRASLCVRLCARHCGSGVCQDLKEIPRAQD